MMGRVGRFVDSEWWGGALAGGFAVATLLAFVTAAIAWYDTTSSTQEQKQRDAIWTEAYPVLKAGCPLVPDCVVLEEGDICLGAERNPSPKLDLSCRVGIGGEFARPPTDGGTP